MIDGGREEDEPGALGVGEGGLELEWSLPTNMGGGSGRRLGVRMRTLREGLGADVDVLLDVLRDGVGEGARLEVLPEGVGDAARPSLGGSTDPDSVRDNAFSSHSNVHSPLSLCRRTGSATASRTGKRRGCAAPGGKALRLADDCTRGAIDSDPRSASRASALAALLGAGGGGGSSNSPLSSSVGLSASAVTLLLSLLVPRWNVGERVRNVTLRLSGLSVDIGRYCDCGLNPDAAFRRVFSRTVSMSCCRRPSAKPLQRQCPSQRKRGEGT